MPRLRNQRILALVLPHLTTDRIARKRWGISWRSTGRPDAGPIICVENRKGAMRLVALDEIAMIAGLKRGQSLSEARAMCPGLDVIEADPRADHILMEALADWCDRYTPLVALDAPDGLYLDITGCCHLFGGEKALLDDLLLRLFHLGFDARAAIASTPGLAWASARFGTETLVAVDAAQSVLPALPMAALRLEPDILSALDRVGLKRVGDILGAPRTPLARRFGSQLLVRLDQALGLEDEPISPRLPVAELSVERRLAEPIVMEDEIEELSEQLASTLKPMLEARGEGARIVELILFRVDGKVMRLTAGMATPQRDPKRVRALFRERLSALHDEIDAGYGFETVRLCVRQSETYDPAQRDFSGDEGEDTGLTALVDRLSARLGRDRVVTPVNYASHIPERASELVATHECGKRLTRAPSGKRKKAEFEADEVRHAPVARRPLRLFSRPEPVEAVAEVPEGPPTMFRWRKSQHRVKRAQGPERIAAEWWHEGEEAPTRDYYRIEDRTGRRFWLFREGLYERETSAPRWFMHGIFA